MSKDYRKTKGMFFVYDPAAGDFYKGKYQGAAQYTKFQWEAHEYKTPQGAVMMCEALGSGFIVVDKDGKQYA